MRTILFRFGISGGALVAGLLCACSGVEPEPASETAETTAALTTPPSGISGTPADPVAFCRSLPGFHVIIGTSNNDNITGTSGRDCIVGLGGQDVTSGGGGDDLIFGGDGDDQLNGGSGNDSIFGGSGQDLLRGTDGDDALFGEDGDDRLFGGNGADALEGGQGQDQLFGESGNDQLSGGTGDDRLSGGDGTDTLNDCQNHNSFDGGTGSNSCTGDSSSSGSANSSTFTSCTSVVACPATNLALIQSVGTLARGRGIADLLGILDGADEFLTPFGRTARETLRFVRANADLLADPATLSAAQRARFPAFRDALLGSSLVRTLDGEGQALIADTTALSAAIGDSASRAQVPASLLTPAQSCGGGVPPLSSDLSQFFDGASVRSSIANFTDAAANNRAGVIQQFQSGVAPAYAAALLEPFADLNSLTPVNVPPGAQGIIGWPKFVVGVAEATVGTVLAATGTSGIVLAITADDPSLLFPASLALGYGIMMIAEGTILIDDSMKEDRTCPPQDCTMTSGPLTAAVLTGAMIRCGTDADCGAGTCFGGCCGPS